MRSSQELRPLHWVPLFLLICSILFASTKSVAGEPDNLAVALRAKYTEFSKQLLNNQYQRTLYLISTESPQDLKGEIYAVVDYPFTTVNTALNNPASWCDVLILHINIQYCHATRDKVDNTILTVNLGRVYEQPLADTYRVEFNYRSVITTPDYFAVALDAENGPLDTHGYRIRIEATTLADGRTFLHFSYAYAFGLPGRIAMQSYLATIGRNKVGFTVTGILHNGESTYIQGVRGVVERNTMRYYLAIDAYLAALTSPAEDQLEKRMQNWYSGTDRYARQLHEVARGDYIAMKHSEYQRQQVAQ